MAKKNSNGEGTVYFNGKYWVGQVTVGRDFETGKLKRKSLYAKSRREVKEKMTAIMFELNNDSYIEPSAMLVRAWSKYWLENFKKPNVSGATYVKISSLIKSHVDKTLGDIQIKSLSVFHIQTMLNNMQKNNLSDAFIHKVYTYTNAMMKQAVKVELIKKNPCENVVVPKSGRVKKIEALNKAEQAALVNECEKHKNGRLFIFLIGTGMRIGEALALNWGNVDFEKEQIIINCTVQECGGHARISEKTKTKSGVRAIYMSDRIKNLLNEIKEEQDAEKNNLSLVFPSGAYTINLSANVRVRLKRYCAAAGVRYVNVHVLRHTFATRALEQQMNVKVLGRILGHSDIKITLNTYSHILSEFEKESMDNFDAFA